MKAVIWKNYGSPDVLQLQEVAKPTPKENEVLIKIHAATVTMGDCEVRGLKFPFLLGIPMRLYVGFRKPKRIQTLGMELSGEIESIGGNVSKFKVGDAVFAMMDFSFGAYAEYVCVSEDSLVAIKPPNVSYEEAATFPLGGIEALHFLGKVDDLNKKMVLVNGAGGSIGTFGVQLAKSRGAEVTAVDHTRKLDMLSSIGADHVIDYTQEDFSKRSTRYDVIFDVIGKAPFARSMKLLNDNGTFLMANPRLSKILQSLWTSRKYNKKVIYDTSTGSIEAINQIQELVESGKIKPVIDRQYPLEQIADAHRFVETGQKMGNVVITIL